MVNAQCDDKGFSFPRLSLENRATKVARPSAAINFTCEGRHWIKSKVDLGINETPINPISIAGFRETTDDAAIVHAPIVLNGHLEMGMVAEGIVTPEPVAFIVPFKANNISPLLASLVR